MFQVKPEFVSEQKNEKCAVWSWCFYDWANSAFTTLILTFVYGTYFTQSIAPDPIQGASSWGYGVAISGFLMLFLAPVCGALADHTGKLKLWILSSSILCLLGTALMVFGVPHSSSFIILVVICGLILANTGFELAIVFYNSLLPTIASSERLGKISSLGWAVGYAGGLASLIVTLLMFIGVNSIGPFIELPKQEAWHIRIVVPFVIVWFVIFALPLFLFVPDRERSMDSAYTVFQKSWMALKNGFGNLRSNKVWRNFLIGSALYRDGLNTLFAMGGIYAAQKYSLQISDILLFGIGINVTAGLGAYAASFFEDKIGSFNVVRLSLIGLLVAGFSILLSDTKLLFFISALSLGIFVGPVQSASRTIVSRLSDKNVIAENYGFYALTGRAAAFFGPLFYALATDMFQTQNAGIVTILAFWGIGFIFVSRLK